MKIYFSWIFEHNVSLYCKRGRTPKDTQRTVSNWKAFLCSPTHNVMDGHQYYLNQVTHIVFIYWTSVPATNDMKSVPNWVVGFVCTSSTLTPITTTTTDQEYLVLLVIHLMHIIQSSIMYGLPVCLSVGLSLWLAVQWIGNRQVIRDQQSTGHGWRGEVSGVLPFN